MQPTEAQARAITTRRTAIVIAGAGSGKTRVLVERYLTLLDEHDEWALNNLVAITFTQKAAAEMRARVRTSLERRYWDALNAQAQVETERWSRRISEMDSARITTIHGLCSDLLRANFAEAGLDPDFRVLDEPDAAQLRADAVDLAFSQLTQTINDSADQPDILELFEIYDTRTIRDTLLNSGVMTVDIDEVVGRAPVYDADTLMKRWHDQWEANARQIIDRLALDTLLAAFVIEQTGLIIPANDKLADIWRTALGCLRPVFDDAQPMEERFEAIKEGQQCIRINVGTQAAWGGKDYLTAAKDLLKGIREQLAATIEEIGDPPGELDWEAARLLPAWYALIRCVQQTYADMKAQRAALDFDDLEVRAMWLLEHHPDVVSRYQNGEIRHLLIDEFQDTNQRQWRIAQRLAPPAVPGALFVVGDPKQSIYAFRGADVSVFGSVHQTIHTAGGDSIDLARSFRTHAPLVERFNAIFERVLVADDNSPVRAFQVALGQPMDAFRMAPPEAPDTLPAIELMLLNKKLASPDPSDDSTDETTVEGSADKSKTKKLRVDELRQWEAREIAHRLKALVDSRRLIYDKEQNITRPVGYGDTALLVQAMTHVNVYESAFREAGIPYITASGRGYYDRQEVHDVMNLLHALYNPLDHLSLAAALHSPLFGLSDDALYALRTETATDADGFRVEPRPLWEALKSPGTLLPNAEREPVRFAADCLTRWRKMAGRITISELLETIFDDLGYLATLTGLPDGALRRGNVLKLLEKARTSGKTTLSDFTTYIGNLTISELREGDAAQEVEGVVQIMTVHASKGLEFPVVVLADASYTRRPSQRDLLRFQEELICKVMQDGKATPPFGYRHSQKLSDLRDDAERRRLLYVAATRVQDLLIISGEADPENRTADGWLGWLLNAIDTEHPLIHEYAPVYGAQAMTERAAQSTLSDKTSAERSTVSNLETLMSPRDQEIEQPVAPGQSMLEPVHLRQQNQARHLAATSIADMGGWLHAEEPREQHSALERFRRRVLYDAPTMLQRVQPRSGQMRVGARQIGDIVHQALRWWPLPFDLDADQQMELLRSYAWAIGIKDRQAQHDAAQQAGELISKFTRSALYGWIIAAQDAGFPVLRELPFVYEQESHIVHGMIDMLFQRPTQAGEPEAWVLVDYKTGRLRRWESDAHLRFQKLEAHAARYHLQLGIYAAAAEQILSTDCSCTPEVYIHYLSYNTSIHLPEATWRNALAAGLDSSVEQLITRREHVVFDGVEDSPEDPFFINANPSENGDQ
jgi:ATP-dependent helicase/nuclease subunit A